MIVDPSKVHPSKFVGLSLKKNFDGFGIHEGKVLSHDTELLGNDIYKVRYLDGDEEDMFLSELVSCVVAEELLLKMNSN